MSLFVINRYEEGDDEKQEKGENHLLALQKRIEERKQEKKLAASSSDNVSAKIFIESEEIKKTRKQGKSRNRKNNNGLEFNGTQNLTISEDKIKETDSIVNLDIVKHCTIEKASKKIKENKRKYINEDSLIEINNLEDISDEINHLHLNGLTESKEIEKMLKKKKKRESNKGGFQQSEITETVLNQSVIKIKKKKCKGDDNISIEGLNADDLLKVKDKLTELAEDLNETDDDLEEKRHEFTILKAGKQMKGKIIKRILPNWLVNPEVVSSNLNSGPSFDEIEIKGQLDSKLIEILKSQQFTRLFPVQDRLLTWLLQCNEDRKKGIWSRDTCVSAPTGSGKTLAYVLPIVEILKTRFVRKIRCLIVLPVQELAAQVYKVIQKYVNHSSFENTRLKVGLVSGAASFVKEQEDLVFKDSKGNFTSRIDILVATPRRLIDHIHGTHGFSLNDLQFVIIDEADRETFDWLHELPTPHSKAPLLTLNNMLNKPIPAQKILFSATLSQDPEKLSRLGLFHPILFTTALVKGRDDDVNLDKEFVVDQTEKGDVGRYNSPNELTIKAIECAEEYKPLAVYHLLSSVGQREDKTLIFTNSCNAAHRLTLLLKSLLSDTNLTIAELSGQMNSKRRDQEYQKFCRGETRVLICSDVLARGVDIPGIKLVISYDPPKHMRAFIHRAGRTGRAGISGTAVFLLIARQVQVFKKLHTDAKKPVPEIETEDFITLATELNYDSHVENLKASLEKERVESMKRGKQKKM